MNYTQNEKIEQVTDTTMVVGIDIGSQTHYARAFDNRGRELTKRVFAFQNDIEGFNSFNILMVSYLSPQAVQTQSQLLFFAFLCKKSSFPPQMGQSCGSSLQRLFKNFKASSRLFIFSFSSISFSIIYLSSKNCSRFLSW